jgi:glycosyltransferase involved in cell wall biosynthesis
MLCSEGPEILCVMRMPPNLGGHGGSQRAWHLVEALRPHGKIHFVLVFRDQDYDCVSTSLAPLEPFVESITRINIAGWSYAERNAFKVISPRVWDLFRVRSYEAPHFSKDELNSIAARLPIRRADIIFAGRLCCAVIVQALIDRRLLNGDLRLVDFDDMMSKFRLHQIQNLYAVASSRSTRIASVGARTIVKRMLARIDAWIIAKHEKRIAEAWHGVGVCSDEDVIDLRASHPRSIVVKIPPSIVHCDYLAPRHPDGYFQVLFIGNLSYPANVQGLMAFVNEAWPTLLRAVPESELTVVGFNPSPDVVALTKRHGFALHPNAPNVAPFYEASDVTIAPILFGSGTRVKILEAMAYGRPVVSTSRGAEGIGMGLKNGHHLLLADTMVDFAGALINLANDRSKRETIALQAYEFQRKHFGPAAIAAATRQLIDLGQRQISQASAARTV